MHRTIILRRYYLPVILLYAVIATTILAVGLLLFPEGRTQLFWLSLGIAEFLLTMPFIVVTYLVYPNDQNVYGNRSGAILSILFTGSVAYVTVMFAFLAVNAFVVDLGFAGLSVQVLLTAAFAVFALLLQLAVAGAEQGTETFKNQADSPVLLAGLLQSAEQKLAAFGKPPENQNALKMLREDLLYKIPNIGKITTNPQYLQLAEKIRNISEKCCQPETNEEILQNIKTEIELLRTEIPIIQQTIQ
ncbi:MAG: hypothetical protein LBL62_08045 [Planctomycetaceae bacterium]|jgi:hypothetical protein|nr:hypothetical protein [Planctomycetaceae bacterium]